MPFVVLGDPDESRMVPLSDDDLASASQYAKVVRAETTDELTAHLVGEVPGQEVWKYLVIAAGMALVGEIALTRWVAMQRRAHKVEPIQFGSGAADVQAFRERARQMVAVPDKRPTEAAG